MSQIFAVLNRRIGLFVFTLCAVAAALTLDPARSSAEVSCDRGGRTIYYVYYFDNSNYQGNPVGVCRESCTGETCTGEVTQYTFLFAVGCC